MAIPRVAKALRLLRPVCAALMLVAVNVHAAQAHPHDALAQCQLPDGSWVMCDDTIHDTLTNKHVKKSAVFRGPSNFKAPGVKPSRRLKR